MSRRRSTGGATIAVAVAAVVSAAACWHRSNVVQNRPEGLDEELVGQPLSPDPSQLSNDQMFAVLLVISAALTLVLMVLLVAALLRGATGVGRGGQPLRLQA